MNVVLDFIRTGIIGGIHIGIEATRAVDLLGPSDGSTGGSSPIFSFNDIQLGFSPTGILWHIAIEPSGDRIVFPSAISKAKYVSTPSKNEIASALEAFGETFSECEPFAQGQKWWRVSRSAVVFNFDEHDYLTAAHLSDRAALYERPGSRREDV